MWLTKPNVLIAHATWKSFVQLDFIHQLETVSAMTKLTLPSVAMMVETVVDHIPIRQGPRFEKKPTRSTYPRVG